MIDLDTLDCGTIHDIADRNILTCMLITANVGTIFEDLTLLELWFKQLKSYLNEVKPHLVAIHCQEVGGKNFESSMKDVSKFTDKILQDETVVRDYSRVRIFLDGQYDSLERFTALGSLYLIHNQVDNIKLYNFKTATFDPIEGRKVLTDNSASDSNIEHVEKVKFPQELFPECRWSRKGFMRTRWLFNDCKPLDLVNIHLFHDASNLVAMEKTPSPYAQNRRKALEFALERISLPLEGSTWGTASQQTATETNNHPNQVPLFIFGDFNFRLDTSKVIQRITDGVAPIVKRSAESNEVVEFVYHRKVNDSVRANDHADKSRLTQQNQTCKQYDDDDGNCNYIDGSGVVMTIGKKLFDCENLDETFRATENSKWLQEFDNELNSFKSQLHEFKISFSPSYPFKEDESGGYSYMKTRCPAWCDRILFNDASSRMIHSRLSAGAAQTLDSEKKIELLQSQGDVIYRLMGNSVPMGDHKPVLLYCLLNLSQSNPSVDNKCNSATNSNTPAIEEGTGNNLVESAAI